MSTCLASLPPDALLHVCSFLRLEDIISVSKSCQAASALVRQSPWLWHMCCLRAFPNSALRLESQAGQWLELFRLLHKSTLGPSGKVLKSTTSLTWHGLQGGHAPLEGSEGKVLGVKAVPAPSKVDYGHTVSQLLSWSQLVECRKAFQLWYCPVGGKGALPNAVYSDNAGVALVRRCFPFGHAGTALHGYPGLRYMEVAILAPAKHTVDCLETAMSAAALPAQLCDVCSQGSVGRQRQQCGVSLGVVESRQGLRMLRHGLQLGYYSGEWEGSMQSVGYHAAEGRLFPGPHDSRWQWDGQPIGRTFGPGDVAGVGVDLQRQLVFFTLNGAVVGAAVPGGMGRLQGTLPGCLVGSPIVGVPALSLLHSQLAVCLQSPGDGVELNLGQERFLFDVSCYA